MLQVRKSHLLMESILEDGKMEKDMGKGYLHIERQAIYTQDTGNMAKSMEMEHTFITQQK